MFQEFYHLQEQPFGVVPDPRFLYFGMSHREALASLSYGIETGQGFIALIAKPGMGKTTLLFRLLELLSDSARTAFVFQTQCTSWEFLRCVAADLGIVASGKGTGRLVDQINQLLIQEANQGRRVVLVVDEAQNLDMPVLETIRMLSNFETARTKLLQIVLAGQPQLADKLMSPDLVQLRQRISTVTRLLELKPDEITEYITHRLNVAGHVGPPLFAPDTLSLISASTEGIPRNINTVCFNALSLGYARGEHIVNGAIIREVVADLDLCPLVTQAPALKGAAEEEAQPIPGGDEELVNLSPRPSDQQTMAELPSLYLKPRVLLWAIAGTACALLLLIYSMARHPAQAQKVDQSVVNAAPNHTLKAADYPPDGTTTFTVIVKQDDTMANICHRYIGQFNARVAKELHRLNPDLSNLDFLQIGQEIRLPSVLRLATPRPLEQKSQSNLVTQIGEKTREP